MPALRRPLTLLVVLLWVVSILAAFVGVIILLWHAIETGSWLRGIPAFIAAQWAAEGLRQLLRGTPEAADAPDTLLTREAAPALWAEVDAVAATLDVTPPATITAAPIPNAAMDPDGEHGPGLLIGLPLLAGLTVGEFRAVLAHEFAHLALDLPSTATPGRGERWIVQGADTTGPVAWISRLCLMLLDLVHGPHNQDTELQADLWTLRVATRDEALHAIDVTVRADLMWPVFDVSYVLPWHAAGVRASFTHAFATMLTGARDPELDEACEEILTDDRVRRWETHPSPARRIHQLRSLPLPDAHTATPDPRPAVFLIPDTTLLDIEGELLIGGDALTVTDWATATGRGGAVHLVDIATSLADQAGDDDTPDSTRSYADILTDIADRPRHWFLDVPPLLLVGPQPGAHDIDTDPEGRDIDDDEARDLLIWTAAAALVETAGFTLTPHFPGYQLHHPDGTVLDLHGTLPLNETTADAAATLTTLVTAEGGRLDVTPGSLLPPRSTIYGGLSRARGPWDGEFDVLLTATRLLAVPSPHLGKRDITEPDDEEDRIHLLCLSSPTALAEHPDTWTLTWGDVADGSIRGKILPDIHIHTTDGRDLRIRGRFGRSCATDGFDGHLRRFLRPTRTSE